MSFCLPENQASILKQKIKDGTLNPEKMIAMSSEERRAFFAEFVGRTNASKLNKDFESKMLLKDQKRGLVTWAKNATGMKKAAKRDLVSRVERMDEALLTPQSERAFLEDLAAQRLGFAVTMEEAGKIAELSQIVKEKESKRTESEGANLEYGQAVIAFNNYANGLKLEAEKRAIKLKEFFNNPGGVTRQLIQQTAGTAKSLKSSLDNSAIFRQGWKTLWSNPIIWRRNASKTFSDITKRLVKNENIEDLVNAEIVSRDNFDIYRKARLAVGTIEEAFPSQLPEKIPGFKRLFLASQESYTAFLHRQRADIFDKTLEVAKENNVELNDEELRSIAKMVNSLTGRSDLGRLEPVADVVNNVLFSPRLWKSHIDTLLLHPLTGAGGSNFVRKRAAVNLLKMISGTATILLLANAFDDEAVDFDPRSANFGKIKVGNTRFDLTGGSGSVVTLIARQISGSVKSSTTGLITELNTGEFGSKTRFDVVIDHLTNKFSPATQAIKVVLEGEDFDGNKPTFQSMFSDLFLPLSIDNYIEMKNDPDSAPVLFGMILESLGIGANTYSAVQNWEKSTSSEMEQFKDKVGEEKFEEANAEFNKMVNDWLIEMRTNDRYLELSNDEKKEVVSAKRREFKNKVFRNNGFKPRTNRKTAREKARIRGF